MIEGARRNVMPCIYNVGKVGGVSMEEKKEKKLIIAVQITITRLSLLELLGEIVVQRGEVGGREGGREGMREEEGIRGGDGRERYLDLL